MPAAAPTGSRRDGNRGIPTGGRPDEKTFLSASTTEAPTTAPSIPPEAQPSRKHALPARLQVKTRLLASCFFDILSDYNAVYNYTIESKRCQGIMQKNYEKICVIRDKMKKIYTRRPKKRTLTPRR